MVPAKGEFLCLSESACALECVGTRDWRDPQLTVRRIMVRCPHRLSADLITLGGPVLISLGGHWRGNLQYDLWSLRVTERACDDGQADTETTARHTSML